MGSRKGLAEPRARSDEGIGGHDSAIVTEEAQISVTVCAWICNISCVPNCICLKCVINIVCVLFGQFNTAGNAQPVHQSHVPPQEARDGDE